MSSILFIIAIIPVAIILYFVYIKDKNKEPVKLLIKLFLSGILSCFLVLLVSDILKYIFPFMEYDTEYMTKIQLFIYVFMGIALVEEGCKWLMTYLIGYNNKEFDEVYDIIVYSVFVSLGFAAFENVLYILGGSSSIFSSITTGIFRGILSVPGHACYGLYIGYFMSLAKVYSKKGRYDKERLYILLSIVVPTILHGIYDYCLMSSSTLLLVFIIFVIILFFISVRRLIKASKESKNLNIKNKFCANCGYRVSGPFCSNCGARQE